MILIEIGNTRWKAAYLLEQGVKFIQAGSDVSELIDILRKENRPVMFASVASDTVNFKLQQDLTSAGIPFMQVKTQSNFNGLRNGYDDYARLGVDRWLALIAARAYQCDCAILDVGTAITFDVLNKQGEHKGGWIAPGLLTMQESLVSRSNRIRSRADAPQTELGVSTEDGLFLGCRAATEGFIHEARVCAEKVFTQPILWLLTGGGLEHVRLNNWQQYKVKPHLVLEGLAEVARNSN